jgi:hypothetical protein
LCPKDGGRLAFLLRPPDGPEYERPPQRRCICPAGRRSGIVVRRSIISRRSEGEDARPLPGGIHFRDRARRDARARPCHASPADGGCAARTSRLRVGWAALGVGRVAITHGAWSFSASATPWPRQKIVQQRAPPASGSRPACDARPNTCNVPIINGYVSSYGCIYGLLVQQ